MSELPPWVQVQNGPERSFTTQPDAHGIVGRKTIVEVSPPVQPQSVLQQRMMLSALEPKFIRYEQRDDGEYQVLVPTIGEAQGIGFLCPVCYVANGGPIGTHSVVCWSRSRGVPDDVVPGPGRWRLTGTGLTDVSLMEEPGHTRSVLLTSGCRWHGFVTDGVVT